MKKLHILFGIGALALATGLAACSEESSSSGPSDNQESSRVSTVESEDDLPSCTDSRDGTVRFIKGTKEGFICLDRKWVYYGLLADVEDNLPGCINSRNNLIAYLYEENRVMECRFGAWEEYDLSAELSSSSVKSSSSAKSSSSEKTSSSEMSSSSAKSSSSSSSDSLSSIGDDYSSSSSSSTELEFSSSSVDEFSSSSVDEISSSCVEETSSSSVSPYGTLTESRDGQVYKTVTIGTQTWMAENLNYNYNRGTAKSYCYDDDPDNCGKYGRLYLWSAAMDSAAVFSTAGRGCGYGRTCSTSGDVRGVCPEGWHLPSIKEWETLFTAVGGKDIAGKMLKSTSGWNDGLDGTDAYGFSAFPAGYRSNGGNFNSAGIFAYFWSATQDESGSGYAYDMYLSYHGVSARLDDDLKDYGRSVRCLQNSPDYGETSAISYGSLTDSRDSQVYKTVTIGTQTWMAENLNYNYNRGTAKSYCYDDNDPSNCDKYGRLYLWSAAMDSAAVFSTAGKGCGYGRVCNTSGDVRGVCPEGWHLPSYEEWETLFTAVGGKDIAGKMLRSTSGWYNGGDGTDAYGFYALPAGSSYSDGGFHSAGRCAYFWSATQDEYYSYYAYNMNLYYHDDNAYLDPNNKDLGYSVRCLQNPN